MSSTVKFFSIVLAMLIINTIQMLHAQDKLPWLDDYTAEMLIGSDTYKYNFTNVEGNDCKIKIEEQVTDKKGATEMRSWIFYLSDMDPSKLSFKAKGKSLVISMEINQSQKFITYFEEGEIDGYTQEIAISMNEVDMARSFIETLRQRIGNCGNTETLWENRDQAFTWLVDHIGKASDKEIQWDQNFQQGSRDYLVDFEANSVNGKGEQESSKYVFDLTDIDPVKMNLRISGKTLILEIPVKDGARFIRMETPAGTTFTDELLVYVDNIESARETFNAFKYVITNTGYERTRWDSYSASLGFVKDHLGEVRIGDDRFSYSLDFEESPAGLLEFVTGQSESDGTSKRVTNAFYLADLSENLELEVSKSSITIRMDTKNKREFIRETEDGKVIDYNASLSFHVADIDLARDIIHAFEYAVRSSEEKIQVFSDLNQVESWFSANIGSIEIDGDSHAQSLGINQENENQLILDKKFTEADGESTDTKFILYPEDISLDELDIKVSGKKLFVILVTGSDKYIKNIENEQLQDFTSSAEILFSDPLQAKNCMAAIRFLKENTAAEERPAMSREEAGAFLLEHIGSIKLPDDQYIQKVEARDEDICKMSFTRVELDEKKPSIEYLYEFGVSDIHPGTSKLSVKKEIISVNLVTVGNEKLIKPYKNGEPGDFVDDFIIYADDVLVAKRTLAAFAVLAEGCK